MDQPNNIRKAITTDVAVLASVIRKSFRDVADRFSLTPQNCPKHPSNCTAGWIESDLARGVQYFILSQDDKPVGCVGLEHPRRDLCYLERLSVLPEWRQNGFGRTLARHAMERAKADGAKKISIGIIADQTELKHWYGGLGFVNIQTQIFSHLPFEVRFMEHTIKPDTVP